MQGHTKGSPQVYKFCSRKIVPALPHHQICTQEEPCRPDDMVLGLDYIRRLSTPALEYMLHVPTYMYTALKGKAIVVLSKPPPLEGFYNSLFSYKDFCNKVIIIFSYCICVQFMKTKEMFR